MDKKLESKELRPNSLYQVTITLDSGDKVIDSLRSFTVEVPKIFTTDISTTMTTSSLIPVKKYANKVTKAASAGTPVAVDNVSLGSVTISYSDTKKKFNKKTYDSPSYGVKVYVTSTGLPKTSTLVTIAPTTVGYNWLSGSYVVTPGEDSDFTINGVFTLSDIEPGLFWNVTGTGMSASGAWFFPVGSPIDDIGKAKNIGGKIYWTNTSAYKPPTAATYADKVSISNTVKASITNSDILSALTWEEDIVKDVPFFFFTDKTGTVAKKDYLYMYASSSLAPSNFVAGSPNGATFKNATGLTLSGQKTPPAYDGGKAIFNGSSPLTTTDLVVFATTSEIDATGYGYPSSMRVAYSIARYIKQADGTWKADWIQKDQDGYPIISTPEVITGV